MFYGFDCFVTYAPVFDCLFWLCNNYISYYRYFYTACFAARSIRVSCWVDRFSVFYSSCITERLYIILDDVALNIRGNIRCEFALDDWFYLISNSYIDLLYYT